MRIIHPTLVESGSLIGVLVLSYFLLSPGLHGGFLLDDYYNLGGLANIDSVGDDGIWQFIFSGISSYLGRPLSLASFAIQHAACYTCYLYGTICSNTGAGASGADR